MVDAANERRAGRGRGYWRFNTWLTAALVLAILVVGNRIAREHLDFERDLSEDQLYAPSEVGLRLVGELEDLVQVKAFFTGNVKLGGVQIAKRTLIDQLEEYVEAARGRIQLTYVDPNDSSEARAEAKALGIVGAAIPGMQGTSVVMQDVWLGLVLRYRGREVVLRWVLPQTFEYAFLGALRKLMREEEATVGFLVRDGSGAADEFADIRRILAGQYRLREVLDLELGEPVPEDVSVLVVARPMELHPRTVFELDQFIQRGGRALFLVDRVSVDLRQGLATPIRTGLESALETWGAAVESALVWEPTHCNFIRARRDGTQIRIGFPMWPVVTKPDGLERGVPVTAELNRADFFWVQPLALRDVEGIERSELVRSSESSWTVGLEEGALVDPAAINARTLSLMSEREGSSRPLAVSLSGRFPSPFLTSGAPAPFDRVDEALFEERVRRAKNAGEEPPRRVASFTDERVLDRAQRSQVVVVGDADWVSNSEDGEFLKADNATFFANLVDWLALEDDLIALRSRVPTERRIDDFLESERRALGLMTPPTDIDDDEAHTIARIEERAAAAAAERRRRAMLLATGASLVLAFGLGSLWKLCFGRAPRVDRARGAAE